MDKRVMKTRKAIHSAMTTLLAKKPIEEITVTELSEAAEINRKTFYNYYSSVYMVAEEMEDEIVERFEETLRKIDFDTLLKDPVTTFNTLARLITSDLDFYENILTNRNQISFLQKIITSLKQRIRVLYFSSGTPDSDLSGLSAGERQISRCCRGISACWLYAESRKSWELIRKRDDVPVIDAVHYR